MDNISQAIFNVFSHIYRQALEGRMPATHTDNKAFFNIGVPVKLDNGEKEIQNYYLYQEGDSYLLTTSKRRFDITITKDNIQALKEREQKVINDFISKTLNVG